MLPPWLRRPTALSCAALACAVVVTASPAAALDASPSADPEPSASGVPGGSEDMTAGLAPLLAAVDAARADRLAADKKYAAAVDAVTRAEARVNSQKGEVADARDIVGAYARAAYQSGPSDLTFLAGLLDADSPTELMRRADTAERVGSRKDTQYDDAQLVLAKAQQAAERAAADRDRASEGAQQAAAAEADSLAQVSEYTSEWADQLAAGFGGAGDQEAANSDAATAWADWLNRPEADGAPTVTVAMVRSGKDLPAGVTLKKSSPGVAYWNPAAAKARTAKARKAARGQGVLLLPDRTVQMATYAVSRLGAGYTWRKNTHDSMDCSALVDRGWVIPTAGAEAAAADRPAVPDGVRGLAGTMRLVDPQGSVTPGDVVFYLDGDHGVNHSGIAVTSDTMIAADPLTGGVNAVPIDPDRVWQVGRPAAKRPRAKAATAVPSPTAQAWQCGADPDQLAQLSPAGKWYFPTDDADWVDERVNPGTEPGMRVHPVLGYARCHDGWDTGDAAGDPIYAVADGIVVLSPNNGGAGNMITISHGEGVDSIYMHLSEFAPGINGTVVKRGQLIGRVGTTGLSSGPHLHFQTNVNGEPVDPRHFFYGDPLKPACNG